MASWRLKLVDFLRMAGFCGIRLRHGTLGDNNARRFQAVTIAMCMNSNPVHFQILILDRGRLALGQLRCAASGSTSVPLFRRQGQRRRCISFSIVVAGVTSFLCSAHVFHTSSSIVLLGGLGFNYPVSDNRNRFPTNYRLDFCRFSRFCPHHELTTAVSTLLVLY